MESIESLIDAMGVGLFYGKIDEYKSKYPDAELVFYTKGPRWPLVQGFFRYENGINIHHDIVCNKICANTAEAILHELAHIVCNTKDEEAVIEQEILWLDTLTPQHRIWVSEYLVEYIPDWELKSSYIKDWHNKITDNRQVDYE